MIEIRGLHKIEENEYEDMYEMLPVMLFTNGKRDIDFYIKNGCRIYGVTKSEEFGFENTYMWYDGTK